MKPTLIRIAVVLSFIASTFFASAQDLNTAIEVNDYFVSVTDSLYAGGQQWGRQFNEAYQTKDFSSLIPVRKKMEKFIDNKLALLGKMKDSFGSENLRLATMDFLAFEKKLIVEAFIPLEKLNKNSTNEEIQKAMKNLTETAARETAEIVRVNNAQEEFAKKNGFTIEKE
jgi:hypothetical protein